MEFCTIRCMIFTKSCEMNLERVEKFSWLRKKKARD